MTRPPLRTSSSRYIRAIQSRRTLLNLSRLPKLPEGAPPLISRRSTPGDLEPNIIWGRKWGTVDDDFTQAVKLEASAEKKLDQKSGKKLSQKAARFPLAQLPSLDIRMIPKKMLVVREQEPSPILSKNPRKEQSDLSLIVITPKATVHRFAVVRVRVKRRIIGALDLIVRRGAFSFPESKPKQPKTLGKPKVKDRNPDSKEPKVLLHDSTLAGAQAWVLPDWTYIIFPKGEVFKMPLPDLVDQMRLGLRQANQKAKAWEDQYVSPETGEFIPLLSKGSPKSTPLPEHNHRRSKYLRSRKREEREYAAEKLQILPRRPPDTWQGPPNAHLGTYKPLNSKRPVCSEHADARRSEKNPLGLGSRNSPLASS